MSQIMLNKTSEIEKLNKDIETKNGDIKNKMKELEKMNDQNKRLVSNISVVHKKIDEKEIEK